MQKLILLLLFCASLNAQSAMHYFSTGNAFPVATSYTVTAIANGVNGCANANGCWQVNGVLGANKTAGLTQAVTLFQMPANGYLSGAFRIKSATACTGTTTLLAGLGTANNNNLFMVSAVTGYDLMAAVSNTNVSTALPLVGQPDSAAAQNIVVLLTSTVSNISSIVAGCSFKVSLAWGVWP